MSPTFFDLGVPVDICRALESRGITEPFPIQRATIEDALAGRDICGRAPTGSGKTLAFGIPLVATTPHGEPHRPRALVLAPTRELADQIALEMRRLAPRQECMIAAVYGGVSYKPQLQALRRPDASRISSPAVMCLWPTSIGWCSMRRTAWRTWGSCPR